ncbi:MAG: WYL domain-containing protein [Actinobacteria bacterium]|nr:WYL domain-containing protein [Actinomycetota bacterium]
MNPAVAATASGKVDRVERLIDLTLLLSNTKYPLTLQNIADQVPGYPTGIEARRQAFERDRNLLSAEGIPVSTEPLTEDASKLGYRIRQEDYFIEDLGLTPNEQVVLNMVLAAVRSQPDNSTLCYSSPSSAHLFISLPAGAVLNTLYKGIVTKRPTVFSYQEKIRHVMPGTLNFVKGHWYLVAWDIDKHSRRTFRLDRIKGEVTVGMEPDKGHDDQANVPVDDQANVPVDGTADFVWMMAEGDPVKVEVLVDHPMASEVELDLGTEKVVERLQGGTVFSLDVVNIEALYSWVLSMGVHAKILGPPEVTDGLVARLRSMSGRTAGKRSISH